MPLGRTGVRSQRFLSVTLRLGGGGWGRENLRSQGGSPGVGRREEGREGEERRERWSE